ncbi:hypothetical protein BHM03_00049930 [Ensete ventricosum]|nr:hypothetical protein BHM03_00049930 [Ensete ventricosum]
MRTYKRFLFVVACWYHEKEGEEKEEPGDRRYSPDPDPSLAGDFFSLCGEKERGDRRHLITHANAKSKSEKFPPPHQDGALGYPLESSYHMDPAFDPPETSFSTVFPHQKGGVTTWSGPLVDPAAVGDSGRKKQSAVMSWMPAKRKKPVGANATNEAHKGTGVSLVR